MLWKTSKKTRTNIKLDSKETHCRLRKNTSVSHFTTSSFDFLQPYAKSLLSYFKDTSNFINKINEKKKQEKIEIRHNFHNVRCQITLHQCSYNKHIERNQWHEMG